LYKIFNSGHNRKSSGAQFLRAPCTRSFCKEENEMAKNTKSKNGVKNDNYSSAYEMDRTGNTYEEENKSKNGYKQDGNTRDCHKNKAEDTWETDRKY
jgi:hypothetical protein